MTSKTSATETGRPGPGRTAAACALSLLALAACAGGPAGSDRTAREAEASYVASIEQAVPLATRAVSATGVEIVGRWRSCMGGWQYEGSGALHVARSGDDAQLAQVRSALTAAGWTDHSRVEGHVSVEKGGLDLDLQRPNAAFPSLWAVFFYSECHILTGSDKDYVEQTADREFPELSRHHRP